MLGTPRHQAARNSLESRAELTRRERVYEVTMAKAEGMIVAAQAEAAEAGALMQAAMPSMRRSAVRSCKASSTP
jgi:hypothetical protein